MDIPTQETVIRTIEAFCVRHDMAHTRFGAEATGEPQLLSSLRGGRSPSLRLLTKIRDFIERKDREAGIDHVVLDTGSEAAPSAGKIDDLSTQVTA